MTVDESSSQDATLIDDDLVAALGFEPVTTIETTNGHVADDGDEASDDTDLDLRDDTDPIGVDEVSDEVAADEVVEVEDLDVAEVEPEDLDVVEVEDLDVAEPEDLDVVEVEDFDVPEPDVAEVEPDVVAVDEVALDAPDADVGDTDSDAFASAGGSFFDLDAEEDETFDLNEIMDLDGVTDEADTETETETDTETDTETEIDTDAEDSEPIDLIDLEAADLDDAEVFDEAMDLADPDSVFAEHGTADVTIHPVTESVSLLDPSVGDHTMVEESIAVGAAGTAAANAESSAPRRQRRIRARKSRRVIRHIDPWSVLTFSVLFHMVVFAALLLSSVLVWNAAIASGMVENIESFIQELGDYETFEINADVMFRAAVVIAGMLTLASSVMVVLLTVVFNLISDLVGGIRVTVIEEETVRVPIDKKRSKVSIE